MSQGFLKKISVQEEMNNVAVLPPCKQEGINKKP